MDAYQLFLDKVHGMNATFRVFLPNGRLTSVNPYYQVKGFAQGLQ